MAQRRAVEFSAPEASYRPSPVHVGNEIIAALRPHPALRDIRLVGSRAERRATDLSDWDFRVEANDFAELSASLPSLLARLEPLSQQWDRLSDEFCWMLMLRGPVKVDLIFVDEPHPHEPPWKPTRGNLDAIDAHFWDWMLWLRSKAAKGQTEVVATELEKLFAHLLAPLGAPAAPSSIREAVNAYRRAREEAETRFGWTIGRELESEVTPALD